MRSEHDIKYCLTDGVPNERLMRSRKNWIDEKGNYHNVENLTLTQIYDRGVEEGFRIARMDRMRGEWKYQNDEDKENYGFFICSCCGQRSLRENKYCFSCGASMMDNLED